MEVGTSLSVLRCFCHLILTMGLTVSANTALAPFHSFYDQTTKKSYKFEYYEYNNHFSIPIVNKSRAIKLPWRFNPLVKVIHCSRFVNHNIQIQRTYPSQTN